ncbi:MAG TPA: ABC transporter ATP-binding protein [Chloroflexota bacterium]|jgi:ABC-type branched-subunit amino acid transport system ATPase component
MSALLQVDSISRRFGGIQAVDGATFDVEAGSISGLIGPNGAGKTTAFNLISGFLRTQSGAITFDGKRIEDQKAHMIARQGLVRTFQIPRVLTRMSVLENVQLAATHQPGETLGAALFVPRAVSRREREVRDEAMQMLELVRLSPLASHYAGTLSGGQRKLLELARALMTRPRMILLDEPMAGVAPTLALQLLEHILELQASRGTTFLVIEHDMEAIMAISERVVVMDEGRVIAIGSATEIQQNERVIEAYLGRREAEPAAVSSEA